MTQIWVQDMLPFSMPEEEGADEYRPLVLGGDGTADGPLVELTDGGIRNFRPLGWRAEWGEHWYSDDEIDERCMAEELRRDEIEFSIGRDDNDA